MMKVSLAEFLGGKEADDAYNKLCELTGGKWDVERTCRVERRHVGPLYNVYKFSCCEEEWAESNTDQHASAIDETVCPRCGAKVIE